MIAKTGNMRVVLSLQFSELLLLGGCWKGEDWVNRGADHILPLVTILLMTPIFVPWLTYEQDPGNKPIQSTSHV